MSLCEKSSIICKDHYKNNPTKLRNLPKIWQHFFYISWKNKYLETDTSFGGQFYYSRDACRYLVERKLLFLFAV